MKKKKIGLCSLILLVFFRLFRSALALVAPLVSALTVTTSINWTNAGPSVVEWTAAAGDPQTFDVELINQQFNSQFALANNIPTSQGSLSLNLPQVPVGYVASGLT